MLLIFLGAVQIADRLSGAAREGSGFRQASLSFFSAFAIERGFRFRNPSWRGTGAPYCNLYVAQAAVQFKGDRHSDTRTFKIAELEIGATKVSRTARDLDLCQHLIRRDRRLVSVDKKFFGRYASRSRCLLRDEGCAKCDQQRAGVGMRLCKTEIAAQRSSLAHPHVGYILLELVQDGKTVLGFVAGVDILGKLAALGHGIIKRKADQVLDEFAQAVKKRMEEAA